MNRTVPIVMLSLVSVPGPANAQTTVLSASPTSQWVLDYGDNACFLRRAFKAGETSFTLEIAQSGPGPRFALSVVAKGVRTHSNLPALAFSEGVEPKPPLRSLNISTADGASGFTATTGFAPDGQAGGPSRPERDAAETLGWYRGDLGDAAQADRIVVADIFPADVTLETGRMDAPMKAMRQCLDDLFAQWGYDPAQLAALTGVPTPANDPADWATPDDYPRDALRKNENARVDFRLDVDAEGRPTACHVQMLVGLETFGETVCRKVKARARFKPALDKDGKPVPGPYTETVVFMIPKPRG
jgi:hypothetical protein